MQLTENQTTSIRNFFVDKPVIRAYLFGSYVRDDASDESDVDILVDLDYSVPIGLEFIGMALDLEDMLKKKVDLVSSNGLSKYVAPFIEKEKEIIYKREAKNQE